MQMKDSLSWRSALFQCLVATLAATLLSVLFTRCARPHSHLSGVGARAAPLVEAEIRPFPS